MSLVFNFNWRLWIVCGIIHDNFKGEPMAVIKQEPILIFKGIFIMEKRKRKTSKKFRY